MHVVWYTAMSMDGRIADANESLAFLGTFSPRNDDQPGFEQEFRDFISTIDAVLIGAGTLRWLIREGHGRPGDRPTWLVSHDPDLLDQVGDGETPFHRVEGVDVALTEIEAAGHDRVWLCGGGSIAGQALALDQVDEVLVTIAPTALGAGPALFDAPALELKRFSLVEARSLGGDAARLRWLRNRS